MKTIRKNVFETNSSSVHTITVSRKGVVIPITEQQVSVKVGSFGWEFDTYSNIEDILSYIYTAICCLYDKNYREYTDKIDKVLNEKTKTKIEWIKPKFNGYKGEDNKDYYYLEDGYIDHSDKLYDWLNDLFSDDHLLLDTIFGGSITTGNDNDDWDELNFSTFKTADEEDYYYNKGNG